MIDVSKIHLGAQGWHNGESNSPGFESWHQYHMWDGLSLLLVLFLPREVFHRELWFSCLLKIHHSYIQQGHKSGS